MRISIHAPRTGSDAKAAGDAIRAVTFQSTLPARGATGRAVRIGADGRDFNPRSPHGERRKVFKTREEALVISIHAPRTGSDFMEELENHIGIGISIHAPRTGSD